MTDDTAQPLKDLIGDFAVIADQLVPYGQLPPRLSCYAEKYPRWGDLGAQTCESLTAQPAIGPSALNTIIDTARRAIQVAMAGYPDTPAGAAAKLLDQIDPDIRTILTARVIPLDPQPTGQVAATLGCAGASVTRRARRAERQLAGLLEHPEHQALQRHARLLAHQLGPYLPSELASRELALTSQDLHSDTAALLLHVAGPYRRHQDWLENSRIRGREHIETAAAQALTAAAGALRTAELTDLLMGAGMHPEAIATYLEEKYLHRTIAGQRITHSTDTTATTIAAVLHAHQRPLTLEQIHTDMGIPAFPGSLASALSSRDEFVRASRTTWALRTWDLPHYTSINAAIGQYIDNHGGQAPTAQLLNDIQAAFPDISARSLQTYLATPRYITRDGYSRRRTATDPGPRQRPLHHARGVFRTNTQVIRLALPVTNDVQRGSGRSIAVAIARAAHIKVGSQQTFTNPEHKPIRIAWVTNASNNAHIGSLRTHAHDLGATLGDTLIIALNTHRRTYTIAKLDTTAPAAQQLAQLTGRDTSNPNAAMAAALDNPQPSAEDILRRRGDECVADLLEQACAEATTTGTGHR
ncbi:MAG: hypothetical protein HYZ38_24615 [Mycobacterium sp.]|nr:hypothetical protein [Mycobacterium sp.]